METKSLGYVVLSHYPDGPSVWYRTTLALAKELAIGLLRDEVPNMDSGDEEEDQEAQKEVTELLDQGKFWEAHEVWQNWQIAADDSAYLEAIIICECEIDGNSGNDLDLEYQGVK